MQVEIVPEFHIAARIFSPFRAERLPDEYLPQLLALGFSYRPSDKIIINVEAHQDTDHPLRIRAGIEYMPAEELSIRMGVTTESSELSFGLGYQIIERLDLSAGAVYHEVLGVWPGIGVRFK